MAVNSRAERWQTMDGEIPRESAEGISVYDNRDYAVRMAIRAEGKFGVFVVPLNVPDDGTMECRQTGRNKRHHTIYGHPEELLQIVAGKAVAI